MSFSVSFFARDVHAARSKLQEVHAPAAVKALVELAIAGIPPQPPSHGAGSQAALTSEQAHVAAAAIAVVAEKSLGNRAVERPPRLCGILVETNGHIDERGARSGINMFRVEPYYD